jgi:anti-sigma factor RsiW
LPERRLLLTGGDHVQRGLNSCRLSFQFVELHMQLESTLHVPVGLRFSLATLRQIIHSDNQPYVHVTAGQTGSEFAICSERVLVVCGRHIAANHRDGFERALEVEAHLASCRGCASEVQSWKDARGALQRSDLYYRAPANLEEKIRRLVPRENGRERVPWFHQWIWAGGGAAFATVALLITFMISRPGSPTAEQDVVTSHIRSLMANHLMDVISTDQHTVKPWFDGRLDFAPPVRDLATEGYPLAGGRLDYLDHRAVAVLVYRRALHSINLYVWPAVDNGVFPGS